MSRQTGRLAAAVAFAVLASPSFGQIVPTVSTSSSRFGVTAPGCSEKGGAGLPARSQPYTAELKTTTVRLLASGATLTRQSTEIRAVDSQQRTFTSRTQEQFSADQPTFTFGNVEDPVESTQISWNSQSRTAQVIKLPPESERHGCWATDSGNMRMNYGPATPAEATAQRARMKAMIAAAPQRTIQPKTEDLGTITIEGVEAHGDRVTEVIPVGQIGNDRELTITTENWYAPSLGLQLRQVRDDPQNGKSTMEVTRLDLSEPPLTTFQPPEGYEVTMEELHQVSCETRQMPGFAGIGVVSGPIH